MKLSKHIIELQSLQASKVIYTFVIKINRNQAQMNTITFVFCKHYAGSGLNLENLKIIAYYL